MATTWNTKFGVRRVRHDPPTIAEAIDAAEGLTDDRDQQIEFAALLMGVPEAAVRAEMTSAPRAVPRPVSAPYRAKIQREFVIEHKASRRRIDRLQGDRAPLRREPSFARQR